MREIRGVPRVPVLVVRVGLLSGGVVPLDWEVQSAHRAGQPRSLRVERYTFEGGGAEVRTAYGLAVVPQQDHVECTQGL